MRVPQAGIVGMHAHRNAQLRNAGCAFAQASGIKLGAGTGCPLFQPLEGGLRAVVAGLECALFPRLAFRSVFAFAQAVGRVAHGAHETHVVVGASSQLGGGVLQHLQVRVRVGYRAFKHGRFNLAVLVVLALLEKGNAERPLLDEGGVQRLILGFGWHPTGRFGYSMERSMASASRRGNSGSPTETALPA